jgi:hypothetical protein
MTEYDLSKDNKKSVRDFGTDLTSRYYVKMRSEMFRIFEAMGRR